MSALGRSLSGGIIKANSKDSVGATIRTLQRNVRLVFYHLRITLNAQRHPQYSTAQEIRTNLPRDAAPQSLWHCATSNRIGKSNMYQTTCRRPRIPC